MLVLLAQVHATAETLGLGVRQRDQGGGEQRKHKCEKDFHGGFKISNRYLKGKLESAT